MDSNTARLEPFSLDSIKMALVCKAIGGGFLQPLRSFFSKMTLAWADVSTARARMRRGVPLIELGRKFFADNVLNVDEAAEIVFHEILHHLFRHLDREFNLSLRARGFTDNVINLAEDAIINAYLDRIGCAGFMRRYYSQKGVSAFLRPGCESVFPYDGAISIATIEFMNEIALLDSTSRHERMKAQRAYDMAVHEAGHVWMGHQMNAAADSEEPGSTGSEELELPAEPESREPVFPSGSRSFYNSLYTLTATLEESLAFFLKNYPNASSDQSLLGSHEVGDDESETSESPSKTTACGAAGRTENGELQPGGLFDSAEAQSILQQLGINKPSARAKDNFEAVIKGIKTTALKDGATRLGQEPTRRMPAKLSNRDVFATEKSRVLFTRSNYKRKRFSILVDVSGSVTAFIPFVVGLIASLRTAHYQVDCHCWADIVDAVTVSDLKKGNFSVGSGTSGEAVARYISKHAIENAVIITDNAAGVIRTAIEAKVYLCLFPHSSTSGSFLDAAKVRNCSVHQLLVEGLQKSHWF